MLWRRMLQPVRMVRNRDSVLRYRMPARLWRLHGVDALANAKQAGSHVSSHSIGFAWPGHVRHAVPPAYYWVFTIVFCTN